MTLSSIITEIAAYHQMVQAGRFDAPLLREGAATCRAADGLLRTVVVDRPLFGARVVFYANPYDSRLGYYDRRNAFVNLGRQWTGVTQSVDRFALHAAALWRRRAGTIAHELTHAAQKAPRPARRRFYYDCPFERDAHLAELAVPLLLEGASLTNETAARRLLAKEGTLAWWSERHGVAKILDELRRLSDELASEAAEKVARGGLAAVATG